MKDRLEVVSCIKEDEQTYQVVLCNNVATHVMNYCSRRCVAFHKSSTGQNGETYLGASPEYAKILCDYVVRHMRVTNCNEQRI